MTRTSSIIAGLAAATAGASLLLTHEAGAHIYQMVPTSRQFSYGPLFKKWDDEHIEYCPHCYNARGPKYVRERAERLTDKEILKMYGDGEFPLKSVFDMGGLAKNGNYLEPQEISVRHGVCGDPEQNAEETSNVYSTPNSNWPVIDSYKSGQVLDMTIVMNAYHWGHCEFFVCDANDQEDGADSVVTQRCLNMHPLDRAEDDGKASPIDPNYKGRYYVDPPCRKGETNQTQPEGAAGGYNIHMRYVLPDIECDHCILQMVYYTGNSCKHVGYDEFKPDSWPSKCAPEKKNWIELNREICGENGAYPEEFWACSDISIKRDGSSPSPSPPGEDDQPTAMPTAEEDKPTDADKPTTADMPTAMPTAEDKPTDADKPTAADKPSAADMPTAMPTADDKPTDADKPTAADKPSAADMPTAMPTAEDKPTDADKPTAADKPSAADMPTAMPTAEDKPTDADKPTADSPTSEETTYTSDTTQSTDDMTDSLEEVPEEGTYEHLGCFMDSKKDRILGLRLKSPEMTPTMCHEHCNMRNAAYMATQYGHECWCSKAGGLDYERHGTGVCDHFCEGDETETCGGFDAFDLYKLEWAEPSADPEYMDCYADDKSDRIMRHMIKSDDMTSALCREHCVGKKAMYYGTQYATECWCGTSSNFSDYERHGEGVCHMACSGDPSVACGGQHAFSLFRMIEDEAPSPTPTTDDDPKPSAMPTAVPEKPTAMPADSGDDAPSPTPTAGGDDAKPSDMPTAKPTTPATPAGDSGSSDSSKSDDDYDSSSHPGGGEDSADDGKGSDDESGGDGEKPADPTDSPTDDPKDPPTGDKCSGEPVEPWEQCGGDTWKGSTCCRSGFECTVMGAGTCYSQCRPMANGCAEEWKQCGGAEWEGQTCCWPGMTCKVKDENFSSCVPDNYEGED